jgi:glycosyltransferase involved in cell wall biosynthesis
MSSSHVFLSASHNEGFGYPVVEAMACGMPVLCSTIPVYEELAPAEGLFPLGDPALLARRVDALTNSDLERMSALSVQRSESLAREDYKGAHRAYFSELVAGSRP